MVAAGAVERRSSSMPRIADKRRELASHRSPPRESARRRTTAGCARARSVAIDDDAARRGHRNQADLVGLRRRAIPFAVDRSGLATRRASKPASASVDERADERAIRHGALPAVRTRGGAHSAGRPEAAHDAASRRHRGRVEERRRRAPRESGWRPAPAGSLQRHDDPEDERAHAA